MSNAIAQQVAAKHGISVDTIDRFITPGSPLARAGGAQMLLRATGGNIMGAAFLAALARKESSFGQAAFAPNNFWGYGVHAGPSVNTAPTVEAMASKVWKGLAGSLYKGSGLTSPSQIINRYAPPSENNTALYTSQVQSWFKQMGLNPNANIFNGPGAASGAPSSPPSSAAPGAPNLASVSGSLDTRRLLALLNVQRQRVLAGQMPTPNYQRQLASLVTGAYQGAKAKATTQIGNAQTLNAVHGVGELAMSAGRAVGGPEKIIGTPYAGTHAKAFNAAGGSDNWESENAVDIAAPVGSPVYALADGTIGSQFGSLGQGGRFAGLRLHLQSAGNEFYYAHLSRFAPGIRPGARVRKGQIIGYSGSANGVAHLHLAAKSGDPRKYLSQ